MNCENIKTPINSPLINLSALVPGVSNVSYSLYLIRHECGHIEEVNTGK